MTASLRSLALAALIGLSLAPSAIAQTVLPSPFGAGPSGTVVTALTGLSSGGLFAGQPGGVVETWNGATWTPVATTLTGNVSVAIPSPFTLGSAVFGTSTGDVGEWDFVNFNAFPTLPAPVQSLTVNAAGNLVAGTTLGVQELVAGAWVVPAVGAPAGVVLDLDLQSDGALIAAGVFTLGGVPNVGIASFDGVTWQPLPGAPGGRYEEVLVLTNGDLLASVRPFGGATRDVWRSDGATWTIVGTGVDGEIFEFTELPDGDVVAGGAFSTIDGFARLGLARFDGQRWLALASANGAVQSVDYLPEGLLVVAGQFSTLDGLPSPQVGSMIPTAFGSVSSVAAGCGAGLQSIIPPFIGGTHVSIADQLEPGIAIQVLGFSLLPTPIPINQLIPGVTSTCVLDVTPEFFSSFPCGAQVSVNVILPDDPVLVGTDIFQQLINLGANGVQDVTNAQRITIGQF